MSASERGAKTFEAEEMVVCLHMMSLPARVSSVSKKLALSQSAMWFVIIASCLMPFSLVPHSQASTYPSVRLPVLIKHSDVIVEVTVTDVETTMLPGSTRIVRFYSARVNQVYHGQLLASEQVRLRFGLPGGRLEKIGQWVPGSPELETNRRYVMLLGRATGPGGARGVVGLGHGIFEKNDTQVKPLFPIHSDEEWMLEQWSGGHP